MRFRDIAERVDALTLAERVADRIHADIRQSNLKEGDLFMTGDQVAERYKVSRSIAREALSQLQAVGVLESRKRKGILIARPDPVKLSARWVPVFGQVAGFEGFRLLTEWRYVLELGAVDLAVAKASNEQIAELFKLASHFEEAASAEGHTPEADKIDLAFHAVILEMPGNPLLAGMHRVLADYFAASAEYDPRRDARKAIREHFVIAEAFERRDAESARSVLRMHLPLALTDQPSGDP